MKLYITLAFGIFLSSTVNSQILLAKWTFPTGTASDSISDGGIPANSNRSIRAIGTSALDFTKNGYTTKAAQATNWDNGADLKSWQVSLTTKGYATIKISSRQQSGGNNPGPKDFRLQYRLGAAESWVDVPGGTITTANDWTTAFIDNLSLPADCNNKEIVYVRWLMSSNTPSSGIGGVLASGISKIDEIYLDAEFTVGIEKAGQVLTLNTYPNPVGNEFFHIDSNQGKFRVEVMNVQGQCLGQYLPEGNSLQLDASLLPKGIYLVRISNGNASTEKKFVHN